MPERLTDGAPPRRQRVCSQRFLPADAGQGARWAAAQPTRTEPENPDMLGRNDLTSIRKRGTL